MSYAKFKFSTLALLVAGLVAAITIAVQPAQADEPDDDAQTRHQFDLTAHWSEAEGAALLSWHPLPDAHSYWIQLTDTTEDRLRWLPAVLPDAGRERYIHRIDSLNEAADYAFQIIARRKDATHYRDNWSNPSALIRLENRATSLSATGPMPVCDRTPEVVAELIRQTGKSRCSEVTAGDLAQVTLVDLRQKEVTALKPGDFNDLPKLTKLVLSQNRISELHPDLFQNLPNLHNIRINDNQLTEIDPLTFRNLPNMRVISAQNNQLSNINVNLFSDLPDLVYLSLCYNKLTALEPETFADLTNLQTLWICQNPDLDQIPSDLFRNNTKLTDLEISGNNIADFHPDTFQNNSELEWLAIDGNPLTALDYRWFNNLSKLSVMDLNGNLLTDLHPIVRERLNRLTRIYISTSPEEYKETRSLANKLNTPIKYVYSSKKMRWDDINSMSGRGWSRPK